MTEMNVEHIAIDRDYCLRSLISQAAGREVHPLADRYLIEQLNESHIGGVEEGDVTECKIGGCALKCLTVSERGVLRFIDEAGIAKCD